MSFDKQQIYRQRLEPEDRKEKSKEFGEHLVDFFFFFFFFYSHLTPHSPNGMAENICVIKILV